MPTSDDDDAQDASSSDNAFRLQLTSSDLSGTLRCAVCDVDFAAVRSFCHPVLTGGGSN